MILEIDHGTIVSLTQASRTCRCSRGLCSAQGPAGWAGASRCPSPPWRQARAQTLDREDAGETLLSRDLKKNQRYVKYRVFTWIRHQDSGIGCFGGLFSHLSVFLTYKEAFCDPIMRVVTLHHYS